MPKKLTVDPEKLAKPYENLLPFHPYGQGRLIGEQLKVSPEVQRQKEIFSQPIKTPTVEAVKENLKSQFSHTASGDAQRQRELYIALLKKYEEEKKTPIDMGELDGTEHRKNVDAWSAPTPAPAGALGGGAKAYASGHFNVAAPLLEQTFHKNPNAATALMAAMAHQRNGNEERAQKLHMQALMHHEAGQGQLTPAQIEHARENAHPDHLVHFDNKVSVQNAIKNMAARMEARGVHPQEAIRMATSQVFDHLGSGPIVQGIQAMKPLYNEPMNIMAEPRAGAQGSSAPGGPDIPFSSSRFSVPVGQFNDFVARDAIQNSARNTVPPMVTIDVQRRGTSPPKMAETAPRTMNNPPGHLPITAPHAARIYNEDK